MKLFICLYLCSSVAMAETYLNVYGMSKHLNPIVSFNENNIGIGVETDLSPTCSITVGTYANSLGKQTTFLTYNAKNLPNAYGMTTGVSAGLATGYMESVVPIVYPFVNVSLFSFGYMPEIEGVTPAVVFGSLKIKFGD